MATQKSDNPIHVLCRLGDCLFYEAPVPGHPGYCYCSHPDKPHYIKNLACPLYRLDWQKRSKPTKK